MRNFPEIFEKILTNCQKFEAGRQSHRLTPPPLRISRTLIKDLRPDLQNSGLDDDVIAYVYRDPEAQQLEKKAIEFILL